MSAAEEIVLHPVIELEGVHKHYATGKLDVHALRGLDLRIQPGELVAIMGPSGSGKTTLMEILGCLSRPTSGRYRMNGRPVDEIDADGLARLRGEEIGFVFQSFNLLPRLTVVENAELAARLPRRSRIERRAARARRRWAASCLLPRARPCRWNLGAASASGWRSRRAGEPPVPFARG